MVLAFTAASPILSALVVLVLQRHLKRQDRAAEVIARDNWTTHVVLRELVRATRELGARLRLPPGW